MSPLVRSKFRLLACAVPILVTACAATTSALAEIPATPVTAAVSNAATTPAAITPLVSATDQARFITVDSATSSTSSSVSAMSTEALPEAPQPVVASPAPGAFVPSGSNGDMVSKYSLTVPAGYTAPRMSAGDKVIAGVRNLASPVSLAGTIISAGYSHITDGQPNYGVDGTAFGKRFGAGVARSASQDIFTNSVMAPILHQDPRYYVLGPGSGFFHRVIYAATRPLITRTDGGHTTVNASLLIGYAGAAALTRTYYPQINRNFHDEATTYGASIGGAAIGFGFTEFSDQLLKAVHLKH